MSARSFPRYPACKDSGVDWLGEIPAHWKVKRLKFGAELNPSPLATRRLSQDTAVSFVPMEAVGVHGGLDLSSTRPLVDVSPGYTYFADGDVVVAKITPCFENGKGALAAGLANGVAFGSTELHVLRAFDALVDSRYLFSVTLSDAFRRLGQAEMYGAGGQKRVPEAFVENFKHPLPRLPEQRAIAAFLGRETARIDTLVAKKERLIELLQEKRAAVITRTVTKGLDPAAPMKDSGADWIGQIPARWTLKRLKYIVPAITVGIVVNPSKYYVDDGVPCLRSLNIVQGRISMNDIVFISASANELHSKSKIFAGDVVVVRTGNAGAAVVVPKELNGANCIDLLIIRRSKPADPGFLYYYINSTATSTQVEVHSVGAIQEHYNTGTLAELWMPVVPIDEQHEIVAFLNQETARIDALLTAVHQAIDHLYEYRAALIAAAVTGKIDVREDAA